MDRRKRTGVALAAGLLFLFVTEILLLFLAGNSLYFIQGRAGEIRGVSAVPSGTGDGVYRVI